MTKLIFLGKSAKVPNFFLVASPEIILFLRPCTNLLIFLASGNSLKIIKRCVLFCENASLLFSNMLSLHFFQCQEQHLSTLIHTTYLLKVSKKTSPTYITYCVLISLSIAMPFLYKDTLKEEENSLPFTWYDAY